MKKITLILTSMLFLLVGGGKVCAQTPTSLVLKGGKNWTGTSGGDLGATTDRTSDVIQFKDHRAQYSYMTNNDWVVGTGGTHTFVVTLGSSNNEDCTLHIAALNQGVSDSSFDNGSIKPGIIINQESITVANNATLTLSVSSGYAAIILWQTNGNDTDWKKVNIASFTRTVTSGGGGGGSASEGKTNVAYAIPTVESTPKYTYTFENGDYVSTTGFSSTNNQSTDEKYQSSKNLWLHNDNNTGKDYDSQLYILLDKSEWPTGTKAILHFAVKASDGFECRAGSKGMQIALQRNSDQFTVCGEFTDSIIPTSKWTVHDLETTVTNDADCEKLFFNCGMFKGDFRFDDIILYKVEEKAATGGSNVFTSDEQVANIASTEFSGLNVGDYICADVTGTPENIKLVCNGKDYALTHFNGSTLWGIKATDEMVSALQANDSQFKGHDLTLNGIDIYKTKTISESSSDNGITLVNNTFVEQDRPFAANKWNTVCLPYKPTAAQATLLFGTGYQISEFTGVSGTTLQFTSLNSIDDFVAGRPYLLMPGTGFATAETSPVVLEDVNITADTPEPVTYTIDKKDYSFSGTFNTKSFDEGEWSTTRFVSNNSLMIPNSTDAMKGLRCYFTLPAAAGARSFSLGFDEEGNTTGVADINRETIANNGDFFNLAGQRVAQPTKGLYIVNGKKVVIK